MQLATIAVDGKAVAAVRLKNGAMLEIAKAANGASPDSLKAGTIQALIEAINAGADEALMLDPRGFVASCNSTNFFIVRGRELWTSTGSFSFKGLTQKAVIESWLSKGNVVREKDFTLAEAYSADEAFITGTLGGVTPVVRIDGRSIGSGLPGAVTSEAEQAYKGWVLR